MLKEAVNKVRRRRIRRKSRSVVDSAARNAASLSDGCNPELGLNWELRTDQGQSKPIFLRSRTGFNDGNS